MSRRRRCAPATRGCSPRSAWRWTRTIRTRWCCSPRWTREADVPEITDGCWSILGRSPEQVMCASSRMVVRRRGEAGPSVVACTLLPYDDRFALGATLREAARPVRAQPPALREVLRARRRRLQRRLTAAPPQWLLLAPRSRCRSRRTAGGAAGTGDCLGDWPDGLPGTAHDGARCWDRHPARLSGAAADARLAHLSISIDAASAQACIGSFAAQRMKIFSIAAAERERPRRRPDAPRRGASSRGAHAPRPFVAHRAAHHRHLVAAQLAGHPRHPRACVPGARPCPGPPAWPACCAIA